MPTYPVYCVPIPSWDAGMGMGLEAVRDIERQGTSGGEGLETRAMLIGTTIVYVESKDSK